LKSTPCFAGVTPVMSVVWFGQVTVGFTGRILNNSGFRFTDGNNDAPTRNPWRIRNTTIAPTIVMKDGQVQVVIGAPGGGRIPTEILQVLVYILDYGLDPLDAVKLPRIFTSPRNRQVQLEHGFTPELLREIRAMRYEPVAEAAGYARLYLIARRGDLWVGVADPRHDGRPRGY
jgi:gamma-glutamyltranspeptidase/glutathione hydrolase